MHVLTSPALPMRKKICFPVSKTLISVFISHNPSFLGRIASNSYKREQSFAHQGLWRIATVLKSPTRHTYMEPSLFSSQRICQNCYFSATHIKVQNSWARDLHSCIFLLLHFPVLESRAWISLMPAILCICGTRIIYYCCVPSRQEKPLCDQYKSVLCFWTHSFLPLFLLIKVVYSHKQVIKPLMFRTLVYMNLVNLSKWIEEV